MIHFKRNFLINPNNLNNDDPGLSSSGGSAYG